MKKPLAFCLFIALFLGAVPYTGRSERVAVSAKRASSHARAFVDASKWNLTTFFAMLFCLYLLELYISIKIADGKKKKCILNRISDDLDKMSS